MKRFLTISICIIVILSLSVFTVSASGFSSFNFKLSDFTASRNATMDFGSNSYTLSVYNYDGTSVAYNTPTVSIGGYAIITCIWDRFNLSMSAGDVLRWNGFLSMRIGGNSNSIQAIRFEFVPDDNLDNTLVWEKFGLNLSGGAVHNLPLNFSTSIKQDVHFTRARMQVRINFPGSGGGQFFYQINSNNNTMSYGNSLSPEYPSYSQPGGSGELGSAESNDDALMSGASGGLSDAGNLFSGFGSLLGGLRQGMLFVSGVVTWRTSRGQRAGASSAVSHRALSDQPQ